MLLDCRQKICRNALVKKITKGQTVRILYYTTGMLKIPQKSIYRKLKAWAFKGRK